MPPHMSQRRRKLLALQEREKKKTISARKRLQNTLVAKLINKIGNGLAEQKVIEQEVERLMETGKSIKGSDIANVERRIKDRIIRSRPGSRSTPQLPKLTARSRAGTRPHTVQPSARSSRAGPRLPSAKQWALLTEMDAAAHALALERAQQQKVRATAAMKRALDKQLQELEAKRRREAEAAAAEAEEQARQLREWEASQRAKEAERKRRHMEENAARQRQIAEVRARRARWEEARLQSEAEDVARAAAEVAEQERRMQRRREAEKKRQEELLRANAESQKRQQAEAARTRARDVQLMAEYAEIQEREARARAALLRETSQRQQKLLEISDAQKYIEQKRIAKEQERLKSQLADIEDRFVARERAAAEKQRSAEKVRMASIARQLEEQARRRQRDVEADRRQAEYFKQDSEAAVREEKERERRHAQRQKEHQRQLKAQIQRQALSPPRGIELLPDMTEMEQQVNRSVFTRLLTDAELKGRVEKQLQQKKRPFVVHRKPLTGAAAALFDEHVR